MSEAGQGAAPAGLDARYEQLRHAVLHQRAQAFPLGLGVLVAKGVTAWHRLLTGLTGPGAGGAPTGSATTGRSGPGSAPTPADRSPQQPAAEHPMPAQVSAQLVHALAAVAVALAGA